MSSKSAQLARLKYISACADTRRAWFETSLLGRVRIELVDKVRLAMIESSARELSTLIMDMVGPMHPGDPSRAGDRWLKVANEFSATALEAILIPEVGRRNRLHRPQREEGSGDAEPNGSQPLDCNGSTFIDMIAVKEAVAHWIEWGRASSPVEGEDSCSGVICDESARISDLLAEEYSMDAVYAPMRLADTPLDHAWLRLAVVATSAPAIEAMIIMAALPKGYVDARRGSSVAAGSWPKEAGQDQGPDHEAKAGPMSRDGGDDRDVDDAAARLARPQPWGGSQAVDTANEFAKFDGSDGGVGGEPSSGGGNRTGSP